MGAVAGVATFGDLSLDKAATGYALTGAATSLTGATSAAFTVSAAAANHLVFTVQPSNAIAGAALTPAVQVTAQDGLGNPVTGYTLTAAGPGVTTASSAGFNITPGAASQLAFTVQPSSASAGAAITPAVQVTARDAQGNTATGFTGSVTVAVGTNAGGGTLSGTATVAAASGVATFSSVSISKTGTGYTLTGAASGLSGATSSSFDITAGIASQLAFTVQPSNATAGATITPAVRVTARDAQGNTATGFTGNVTVGLGANPGGGALSGTATVAAVGGVATFSGLSIDKTGTGYTLTAAVSGLTPATSAAFNITPGAPAQLAFTVQPATTMAGATITPAVQVPMRDAQGNTATGFTGDVTVSVGTNPGGGALAGTTSVAA